MNKPILNKVFLLFTLILLLSSANLMGSIRLSFPFGNNMVLQREMNTPIRGTGDPGEEVTVTIHQQTHTATTNADGKWEVFLNPMAAGGPYTLKAQSVNNTVSFSNVMLGDVWVCTGQSNMDRTVDQHMMPDVSIASLIEGLENLHLADGSKNGGWTEASIETVKNITATGFYFTRYLVQQLEDVPIGLLEVAQGGTTVEQWMDPETVDEIPVLTWGTEYSPDRLTGEYWPWIADETQYGIKGIVWYQGENNARPGIVETYKDHLKKFITGWRRQWNQGDFPFFVVQLTLKNEPQSLEDKLNLNSTWAILREAQRLVLNLPNTGLITTIDLGDPNDIHPLNKWDVGLRISYLARAYLYGEPDLVYSGPTYKSKTIDGNKIRLKFVNTGSGLVSTSGDNLQGFRVLDENGNNSWGDAYIDGDEVVVSASTINEPVDVVYGWEINPIISLYNKEGLPASPFKTTGEQVSLERFGCRLSASDQEFSIHDINACGMSWTIDVEGVLLENCPNKALTALTSVQLEGNVYPDYATNKNLIWHSSDTSIVSVTESGLVTANTIGSAQISVTSEDGGFTQECNITVYEPVDGISIGNCPVESLTTGSSVLLQVSVTPAEATNQTVIWTTSDASIASVDASGAITTLAPGTITITATSIDGDYRDNCSLTIIEPVTGVSIENCPVDTVSAGTTLQLRAAVFPGNASNKAVRWSSSDVSIASVTESGLITALSSGNTSIVVTSEIGDYTDECTITVSSATNTDMALEKNLPAIKVYPNPAKDVLYIELPESSEEKNLKLFNVGGQLLLSRSTNGNFFKINTATFKTETILIAKIAIGAEVNFLKILNFKSSVHF